MDLALDSLFALLGMVVLIAAAHYLVEGAVGLARRMGISSLVVGLTVVAFGTSAPELAAGVSSSLKGHSDLAIGAVVGSNIANIGLVLGLTALIAPVSCSTRVIRWEVPVMVSVLTLGAFLMMNDSTVSRLDGAILLGTLIAYTAYGYISGKKDGAAERLVEAELEREVGADPLRPLPIVLLMILGGLGGLVLGADLLIRGATGIAESLGVSKLIIGLFLVAVSTSLPELATAIVAARRKQPDIVLGNVLGSNVFNTLCVVGFSAQARPLAVPEEARSRDLLVMLLFALVCVPVMKSAQRITRFEGMLLLGGYLVYAIVALLP